LKRFKNCVLSPVATDGAGWEYKESLALPPSPTESKVLTCLGQNTVFKPFQRNFLGNK
jgi:hypothetical protein